MNFVDRVRICARGGDGGAGVPSFQRQKGRPRGKPNGGSGGAGGDVVLVADPSVASLLVFSRKPHWRAGDGNHGQGELRHGARGVDLELPVPLGTEVRDSTGTLVADLVESRQRVIIASGGNGGKGNAAFVSPRRKAPEFAEQGEYGVETWIDLELKIVTDAALIGFPNVGKSTLISRVSSAQPKIADYPFTTLTPNLGVVLVDNQDFVMADVPGLIEGAAEGKGLGHHFLRHVERAGVLVILLEQTQMQERSAADQYRILLAELARHSPDLLQRPRVVALNKIDVFSDGSVESLSPGLKDIEFFSISAVTGEGVDELMYAVAEKVRGIERQGPDRSGFVLHRPLPQSFEIHSQDDVWIVAGRAAERAVNLDDLTVLEAADLAAARLAAIGVDDALTAAGAQPGDDVRIGNLVFTFEPDPNGGQGEADA